MKLRRIKANQSISAKDLRDLADGVERNAPATVQNADNEGTLDLSTGTVNKPAEKPFFLAKITDSTNPYSFIEQWFEDDVLVDRTMGMEGEDNAYPISTETYSTDDIVVMCRKPGERDAYLILFKAGGGNNTFTDWYTNGIINAYTEEPLSEYPGEAIQHLGRGTKSTYEGALLINDPPVWPGNRRWITINPDTNFTIKLNLELDSSRTFASDVVLADAREMFPQPTSNFAQGAIFTTRRTGISAANTTWVNSGGFYTGDGYQHGEVTSRFWAYFQGPQLPESITAYGTVAGPTTASHASQINTVQPLTNLYGRDWRTPNKFVIYGQALTDFNNAQYCVYSFGNLYCGISGAFTGGTYRIHGGIVYDVTGATSPPLVPPAVPPSPPTSPPVVPPTVPPVSPPFSPPPPIIGDRPVARQLSLANTREDAIRALGDGNPTHVIRADGKPGPVVLKDTGTGDYYELGLTGGTLTLTLYNDFGPGIEE